MNVFLRMLLITAFTVGFSSNVMAKTNGEKGFFERITDAVVDMFDGKNDSADEGKSGNQNALEQIDKNIEKHGGSHKGLENARANVAKNKSGSGDDTPETVADVIEDAVEDVVTDAAKDLDDSIEDDKDYSKGRTAHPGNNGKGKGKDK